MAEVNPYAQQSLASLFFRIMFAAFIAAKVVGGLYVSTWSWWWLLMPSVPFIGACFHGGL
jgi:hypothetical protein